MWRVTLRVICVALATALTGCAAMRQQKAMEMERMLVAAGFQMRIADTSAEIENLKTLPKQQMFSEQHDGELYYIYADDEYCKCVYAGSPEAYQRFQKLAINKEIADKQLRAARLNQSAAMSWRAWGPWYRPWY